MSKNPRHYQITVNGQAVAMVEVHKPSDLLVAFHAVRSTYNVSPRQVEARPV